MEVNEDSSKKEFSLTCEIRFERHGTNGNVIYLLILNDGF